MSTHGYAGRDPSIGNSGSYLWSYPSNPDSLFFVVVANDGTTVEGSYGTDGAELERPPDPLSPLTQDFSGRCD